MLAAGGTGGHLFPAYALAQELGRRGIAVDLVTDMRGDRYDAGFPARAVYRVRSASPSGRSPLALARAASSLTLGIAASLRLMRKVRPSAVVGFGGYPAFPPLVAALRTHAYRHLAPIANRWTAALGGAERYPAELDAFLAHCAANGQPRPTPLLLHYTAGGYNCLHQDLYGAVAFPLQMTVVLSRPGEDFTGGEILLVEQRPRAQSRGEVVSPGRGHDRGGTGRPVRCGDRRGMAAFVAVGGANPSRGLSGGAAQRLLYPCR